ncbi:cytochrome c maturation protein CcmE [Anaerolinea sp.]|uniref:cytochrome c maturation protein CcmE n=1 Tax=Anaerolinea sp. TaxID=1872519 RepID=UPI002ACEF3B0|nr:cytochrome c maturation protein CcmE [Anaerolinea sp.]
MDLAHQPQVEQSTSLQRSSTNKWKFIVGGLLIIVAVVYLIVSSATANAQYFMTVEEVQQRGASVVGRELRVSGAVIGESIQYDPQTLRLEFVVAHTPGSQKEVDAQGGMAAVLHAAVLDPNRPRLKVVYHGVKPDLLTNEAQAIMTGRLGEDGVFYAEELLLKCPTRYEEALPGQAENSRNGN